MAHVSIYFILFIFKQVCYANKYSGQPRGLAISYMC